MTQSTIEVVQGAGPARLAKSPEQAVSCNAFRRVGAFRLVASGYAPWCAFLNLFISRYVKIQSLFISLCA
jgi:hypothetical protein